MTARFKTTCIRDDGCRTHTALVALVVSHGLQDDMLSRLKLAPMLTQSHRIARHRKGETNIAVAKIVAISTQA